MTYDYEDIFERFYPLITDPGFYKLQKSYVTNLMTNWLHDAIAEPYIRKKFSTISLDDDMEEITFELENPIDDNSDKEFVFSVLTQYMVISWMKPQVESILNISMMIGGKEEKKLQSNYKNNIDRLEQLKKNLRKYIRDYGYEYNSYLNGSTT
ncbi:hypothetical protein PMN51_17850 [Blautia wexlerae]|jgi:hypothetical protein|nr:hypothetical protein [Blautia wexlerae]